MSEQRIDWSPGEMIGRAWEKVKADPVGVVLPVFVVMLIQGAPGGVLGAITGALDVQAQKSNDPSLATQSLALKVLAQIVGLLLNAFFLGGMLTFLFKVARGQTYALGDVFSGGRYFGTMLLTLVLLSLGLTIGFILCIIPGVILALGWSLAAPVVVDKNLRLRAALLLRHGPGDAGLLRRRGPRRSGRRAGAGLCL
jgi:hypothetical protein